MSNPTPPNKFATALKGRPQETASDAAGAATADPTPPASTRIPNVHEKPSRRQTKHIGGYFDPAVSRQLRQIALEEDATVQDMLGEALDLLFSDRQKPAIARKPAGA